jgi:Fe-S cluster assembly protein SufD
MQKNSNLAIDNVNHSSNFDKKFFEIDLDDEGSDAEVNILNLVKGTQHYDNNILVNHNAPNCSSRQKVNNILDNQSTAVFNGKVIVLKNAQKTDSEQSNKNLLLSEQSKAHSNPQLEIFADDVKCGHGSTTGALDDSSIFYLRSRGLSEEESRKILIEAFAKEIVEDFSNSGLESDCNIIISKWING